MSATDSTFEKVLAFGRDIAQAETTQDLVTSQVDLIDAKSADTHLAVSEGLKDLAIECDSAIDKVKDPELRNLLRQIPIQAHERYKPRRRRR